MAATFTIANGASLSDGISFGGALPCAIIMPAAWTAADLTFQMSLDGITYYNVYEDNGTELTFITAASRCVIFDTVAQFLGFAPETYMKIRSGSSGSPVAQGAARSLLVLARQM